MVPDQGKPENVVDLAARLAALGYYPVPIPKGCKGPTLPNWQHLEITPDTAADYFAPGQLVGILHKNVLALDIDVYDANLSRAIVDEALRRFPGALERIGEAPKSALFFRMDEPGFKVSNTEKHERDGLSAQVEVRSVSRQIVAYGKHPTTGKPYRWPRGQLWNTPRTDLPEAKREDIEQFRDWCNDRIRKWAGVEDKTVERFDLYQRRDERPSSEAFRTALSHVPADVGYEDWLRGLMAIHDFYGGSSEGLAVAHDWSAPYADYSRKEVDGKWRSFEVGKGVSYKSVFHLAKMNGADMSAIARLDTTHAAPSLDDLSADFGAQDEPDGSDADTPASGLEWFRDIEVSLTDSYLIKGFLGRGAMSVIYGPSNSGKTFKAMDIAFHLACGESWRGMRVNKAAVLYLAAEGGRGVANRIAALKKHTGQSDIPFALRRAGLDLLHNEADIKHIYELAKEVQNAAPECPLLIVIDTLSRVMAGGDENAPADMTALIKNIDLIREATGAHIMLVHHSGKDVARGARGHSSLRAATDTEIEVQNEDGLRAAMVTKQRDYQGGETFAFVLESVLLGVDAEGDDVTSCVVVAADSDEFKAARRKPTKNQKVLIETFDQMLGEGLWKPNPGGPLMPDAGRFKTLQMEDFRAACEGKLTAKNTRDAFLRAFDALSGDFGPFCMASGFVWHTDRKVSK